MQALSELKPQFALKKYLGLTKPRKHIKIMYLFAP